MSSSEACCHEPDGPLLTSHQRILNPTHTRFRKTLFPNVCVSSPPQLLLRVQLPRSIPRTCWLCYLDLVRSSTKNRRLGCRTCNWLLGVWPCGRLLAATTVDRPARHSRYTLPQHQLSYAGHCHLAASGKHPGPGPGLSLSWSYLTGVSHH